MGKPHMKAMPFTTAALKAAEEWMNESGFEAGMIDIEDAPAVTESLAEAFTRFAAAEKRSTSR